MCGIIGYYGDRDTVSVLMGGLKKMEYRGYDSAGLAILDQGRIQRIRAKGKLSELAARISDYPFKGSLGLGHTRWATHGAPCERNAHPHYVNGVAIVHNGIIENYVQLKERILGLGGVMSSETDSELIAHLVAQQISEEKETDLLGACLSSFQDLKGAYSILVMSESYSDELIAFKNGPPIVVGLMDGSVIVASDILAIAPLTKRVFYLNDNEVLHVKSGEVFLFNALGEQLEWEATTLDWTEDRAEKQGFSHFMLKEIHEQPRAVAAAMAPHIDLETKQIRLSNLGFQSQNSLDESVQEESNSVTEALFQSVDRIFIVACGTSYYAAMMGEYLIEGLAGVPVEVDIASEFRYRQPLISDSSLVILISQSGETADTLAALRLVKEYGAKVLSICNVKNSTLDRKADGHLYMNAGVEIGVASTKALSCTVMILNLLALYIAKVHGRLRPEEEREFIEDLLAVPHQIEGVLSYENFFRQASHGLKKYKGFLYMGRGIHYPVAMEGALKLKELAYIHAEGYAAGEMKHGPLALVDEDMAIIMLAPNDALYEKTISNLEEARARGGRIISIGTGDNKQLKALSEEFLSLPKVKWFVSPLLELIPLQLLAFHVAEAMGRDVDQPRNLAKSVTVE